MLKKVCIHDPIYSSCVESRKICCSVCKSEVKPEFYFCKSRRHIICENCHHGVSVYNRHDDGDFVPENQWFIDATRALTSVYKSDKDLSCGDHSNYFKSYKPNENIKKEASIDEVLRTSTSKVRCSNCNSTTTVVYRNERFCHEKSSITSNFLCPINDFLAEQNCEIPRPVVCPVSSCAKMVANDSFPQHFNYDHSKVPRFKLNESAPQEILLNYSTLSSETKCIAIFLLSSEKRSSQTALKRVESHTSLHNKYKDSELLLLMAAKIHTAVKSKASFRKSCKKSEDTSRKTIQLRASKSYPESSIRDKKIIDNNNEGEVVLLWLCRLSDTNCVFTINVSREDKRQGYSYIGDAIHIRHEQNPYSIYKRTDCLSVRSAAVDKLITAENELKVTISIVQ